MFCNILSYRALNVSKMFLKIIEVSNNNSSPGEVTVSRETFLSLRLKFSLLITLISLLIFAWFEPRVSYILVSDIKNRVLLCQSD